MPSHLHIIVSTSGDSLSVIMRDFKKFTAKEIVATLKRVNESRRGWILDLFSDVGNHLRRISRYKIWQDGNHPELLDNAKIMHQKLDYLHNNPVADEIVDEPEEYRYSSARDYCTKKKGYLQVTFIE